MRLSLLATTLLAAALLPCAAAAQRAIKVPADQPTIQAAINSSSNGDTVLVAPGTYRENINFSGKNITVTSSAGAATTILDGGGTAPTVTFSAGEARLATLNGFTIRNGTGPTSSIAGGGGVYIHYASPTIQNNVFTDNSCTSISAQGSPVITGNIITRTHTFSPQRQCEYPGTAILLFGASSVRIAGNTITDNTESLAGTVLLWVAEDTVLENNVISNNHVVAGTFGGDAAISMFGASSVTINGNEITNNNTGGQSTQASAIRLDLVDGTSPGQLPLGAPLVRILNNTIAGNGGGNVPQVRVSYAHSRVQIANNIVSSSNGAPGIECLVNTGYNYAIQGNTPVVVTNNSFTGGLAYGAQCGANTLRGDLTIDPQLTADGNGHLFPHSASTLDTGNDSALPQPAKDLLGNARAQGPAHAFVHIDRGALETAGSMTAPQARLIIAPSRYTINSGTVDITFAFTISAPVAANVQFSLAVDGVGYSSRVPSQLITTTATTTDVSGIFRSVPLDAGSHEIIITADSFSNLPGAASLPVRVFVKPSPDPYPATLVTMDIDPQTTIGSRISSQVRCRLTQNLPGRIRIFDNGNLIVDTAANGTTDVYATTFADSGPHQYECDFQGTDVAGSVVGAQTISPATAALGGLYSLPDPSEYGDPVTIGGGISPYDPSMNGHIRITEGATVILDSNLDSTGSAMVTTTTLTPGFHSFYGVITATSGNVTNTNGSFSQTVHFAPTTIALTASPTVGTPATTIVLTTAASSSYKGAALAGTVDILDNGVKIATPGTLNGSASITLSGGNHNLTAVFNGTAIFAPSTSNSVTIVITVPPPPPPPDFSIAPTNPALTVQTEHHATAALTMTSINNFSGNVQLSCSNLPRVATCTFDKAAYALATTAAVSVVVETSAVPGYKSQLAKPSVTLALCLLPAGLLFLLLPKHLRKARATLILVTIAALMTAGCSSKYPDHTPPGTYTVTVTATGNSNGTAVTHTVPLTLTVTPE